MRRVAVTGLGAVSALGIGVPAFWDRVSAGVSGVRRISNFDATGFLAQVAAEVPDFNPERYFDETEREMLDRFTQFALIAAEEACAQAGLDLAEEDRDASGVSIGSALGGAVTQDERYKKMYSERGWRAHPFTIPRIMSNAAAAHISMRYHLRGPALSFATACAASAHAVGEAAEIIRAGRADLMVAGGADAPIAPGIVRSWEAMRVLAPAPDDPSKACRPFSKDRLGMVLGEGAGIMVLESWDRAMARGATILAEIAGYGATADAGHITQPGTHAPARAIAIALSQGGLEPSEVGYVNAHGTATRLNDVTETSILKRAFGDHARRLCISSTKAVHGHAMGASAALELIATILALQHGLVPPTANYTGADPDCDLDYVPNTARRTSLSAAISNSFAFGGLNAVIAVRRT
ncbi:MAG TPA: beta-ketoacyl-[acyl-carrier-protein] synthase family protein [Vicinamibacterales bacterium]|nr:beta-ketoacyl-[acyl-carrier-protein] synthase family protein [Vicinamibacterales bacterium]